MGSPIHRRTLLQREGKFVTGTQELSQFEPQRALDIFTTENDVDYLLQYQEPSRFCSQLGSPISSRTFLQREGKFVSGTQELSQFEANLPRRSLPYSVPLILCTFGAA